MRHPGSALRITTWVANSSLPAPSRAMLLGPMTIEEHLADINARLDKERDELRIIEEQIVFQMDVLEEAKTRMLVSETPLADREYRVARDDYERLLKQREVVSADIAELQREQDKLLDRMLGTKV